jgi:deoxyadenosine/deoxycytidine kinase
LSVLAISGNVAAGKSTLARHLGAELGWEVFQESGKPLEYLPLLEQQPSRWAFEAQVAFLASKAHALQRHDPSADLIVDRSIYEDAEVFARAWHELGAMDERALDTYERVYRLLRANVARPEAFIFCRCPPETCEERLAARAWPLDEFWRGRGVLVLDALLERWWGNLRGVRRFELDTERWDSRDPEVVAALAHDVRDHGRARLKVMTSV